jgi:hypothetical protein
MTRIRNKQQQELREVFQLLRSWVGEHRSGLALGWARHGKKSKNIAFLGFTNFVFNHMVI